jgi:hypothetical protein
MRPNLSTQGYCLSDHARRGGFPVNRIAEVVAVLDPSVLERS